jgi:hypothetical protein
MSGTPPETLQRHTAFARSYGTRSMLLPRIQALGVILGTSLNGFGKKQGFVVEAGQDVRGVVGHAFDIEWSGATVWS